MLSCSPSACSCNAQEPEYTWRGLMIDSGRRFFPVPLVKNLMDTMAANKMNVLHLHASDHCRFGVESKIYPKLHTALTGIHKGYYTQEDVKDMIAYGKKNGALRFPQTYLGTVVASQASVGALVPLPSLLLQEFESFQSLISQGIAVASCPSSVAPTTRTTQTASNFVRLPSHQHTRFTRHLTLFLRSRNDVPC